MSTSTDLTTGTQFKDVMRERIMATFLDLIPKEQRRLVSPGDRLRNVPVRVVLVKKPSNSRHLKRCDAAMGKSK